jgi:hypothetical protein
MRKRQTRWLLLVLFAARLVSVQAADTHVDISQIIDKAAAEGILEEPVKAPAPRNVEGSDGYYSKCNYYSAKSGRRLILRLYQAAAGFDPQKQLELVAETTGAMRAISGLGDKARISAGPPGGLPQQVVMLYVIKANSLITIGIAGLEDENIATEKAKAIAQKILAKL